MKTHRSRLASLVALCTLAGLVCGAEPAATAQAALTKAQPQLVTQRGQALLSHVAPVPNLVRSVAAGQWVTRMTAGSATVTDSQAQTWTPSIGLTGGTTRTVTGSIGQTASPQLYRTMRLGVTAWTIPVPAAGRYAVDVLLSDTTADRVGSHVFAINAIGGQTTTVLTGAVDPAQAAGKNNAFHITGLANTTASSLKLQFVARAGTPMVSGVKVTSDGPVAATRTVLDQTFTGAKGSAPDAAIWTAQQGTRFEGSATQEGYSASRQFSQLDGQGNLAITAQHVTYRDGSGASAPWTSARLVTKNKFAFGYGKVQATVKTPAGSGLWPAFWAMGTNEDQVGWPRCGEVDIMEALGRSVRTVAGHVHFPASQAALPTAQEASLGYNWNAAFDVTKAFHTYGLDYEPGFVTFYLDGTQYFTAATEDLAAGQAWPFDGSKYYLILNLAVGSSNWPGWPDASTPAAATMLVDRVTVTS